MGVVVVCMLCSESESFRRVVVQPAVGGETSLSMASTIIKML